MMYFYDVDEPGEYSEDDPGDVWCTCKECGCNQTIDYDKFDEFHDDYVVLKDGEDICCERCGAPSEKIITLRPEHLDPYPTNQYVPKCPICHSPKIHKITTAKKVSRVAMFGIFSLPKIGKEWKCDNCNSEF